MGCVSSAEVAPRWGVRPLVEQHTVGVCVLWWSGPYYHLVAIWNLGIFLKHITRGSELQ